MNNLIPRRHEADLFTADLAAAGLKEMTDHLEFPIFSIQPQPHRGLRRLEFPNPRDPGAPPDYIELRPGLAGLPTIQDQDLLIYCCSKAMSEVNAGRPVPENIQMSTAELLRFANRALGGKQYEAIETAIYRLTELTLVTNIRGEDEVYTELFGIVDRASMVRGTSLRRRSGALLGCSITLSKWMREAIEARKILTLHDDYFRVRRPIDRAVYQLVRKHCGEQKEWTVGVDRLGAKIGSTNQRLSNFRQTIERFAGRWEGENFLDYDVRVVGDRLVAGYAGKGYRRPAAPPLADRHISPETVDEIRRLDPGIDVGRLEAQWRKKADGKGVPIRSADAAFLGYAKKAVEKRRRPATPRNADTGLAGEDRRPAGARSRCLVGRHRRRRPPPRSRSDRRIHRPPRRPAAAARRERLRAPDFRADRAAYPR